MFTLSVIDAHTGEIVDTLEQGDAMTRDLLNDDYLLEVTPVDSSGFQASDVSAVMLTVTDSAANGSEQLAGESPYRFALSSSWESGLTNLLLEGLGADDQTLMGSEQALDIEIVGTEGWSGDVFTLQGESLGIDDGGSVADTVVRDATNPETSSAAGTDGLWDNHGGSGYLDMGGQSGDAVYFEVDVGTAGIYQLDVRYASSGTGSRPMAVLVDGNDQGTLSFTPTGTGAEGWETWEHATLTLTLTGGTNVIRFENLVNGGPNIDSLTLTALPDDSAGSASLVLQAEDDELVAIDDVGASDSPSLTRVVDADHPDADGNVRGGAMGGGYIDFGTDAGDAITFTVTPGETGVYTATIRYANGGTGDRPLLLSVNGADPVSISFPPTGGWNSWGEVEVSVSLPDDENSLTLSLPSTAEGGVSNGPNIDQIGFEYAEALPEDPTLITAIEGEALTIDDGSVADTVVRDADNPESNGGGADGLWGDFSGTGYLDMGAQAGDAAGFSVNVAEAGIYLLTIRYANSGTADRPMALSVDGEVQGTVAFGSTGTGSAGWENWTETSVEIELNAGDNLVSLANIGNTGPNIDSLSIHTVEAGSDDPVVEPGERFQVKINFQPQGSATPDGYIADTGLAFGQQSLQVDGQTYQYGWVTAASIADGTADGTTPMSISGQDPDALGDRSGTLEDVDPLQATYAGFSKPGYGENAGWEIELEDGYYEVTVSIGDSGGAYDSVNVINAEGEAFGELTPLRPDDFPADDDPTDDSDGYRSTLVTRIVQVTDGRLTLDSIGVDSANTEIQYIEIQSLPDLTPDDDRAAPEDYAYFTDPRAVAGVGEQQVEVHLQSDDGSVPVGIDPTSDIFIGISVVEGRGGALLESLNDGSVRLFNTVTGEDVAFNINTTGGFDSLTISPVGELDEYTSYTLVIDGFQDRGDNDDPSAPTREFQKFTTTFVTGAEPEVQNSEVSFDTTVELNGAEDGAYLFTSITMSPDNSKIYVSTMNGEIKRYDVDPDTGALSNEQTLALDYFQDGDDARGILGLTFDPADPNVLWVTDNYPIPLSGRDNGVPDFSGRISKITIGSSDSAFTGTAETYITGLPRSNGDHATNSLVFHANPEYDAEANPDVPPYLLYVSQGANTAMGGDDSAWGNRPERLLNAAILEVDPYREAPEGGFDVSTEPLPTDGSNTRYEDDDGDLKNGPIDMGGGQYLVFAEDGTATMQDANGNVLIEYYDPYAEDAVLKIYATGIRNGYDLVWHSNGNLYVPTNGSAAGGTTPDDPSTPSVDEGLINVGIEGDHLFKVEEGGYYGHPNPLHDEYILNGGNPTSGTDPFETDEYGIGTQPDGNYRLDDVYALGTNRSPNGAIEYTSNVFGTTLEGSLLFVEYSGGDDIRWISLDEDGNVSSDTVLRDVDGNVISYVDPLDIIENPLTGQLYLMTLNRSTGESQIVRLDPVPGDVIEPGDGDVELTSIATIQAEDDNLAVIASGDGAQIVIRDGDNPEPTDVGSEYGVRPGAYGLDGNTDDSDGVIGGYVDFGNTNADYLEFNVDVSAADAGDAVLRVRFGTGGTTDRPLEVFVNGESIGTYVFSPPVGTSGNTAWNTWQTLDIPAELIAGANTVRFQSVNNTGPNIDQLEVLKEDTTPGYAVYEAETAQLVGGAVVVPTSETDRGASGTGFVDFVGSGDQAVTWTVDAAESGIYELSIRYSLTSGKADRPLGLTVNGAEYGAVNFPASSQTVSDWVTQTVNVTLASGSNIITLTAPNGVGPDIDSLEVPDEPTTTSGSGDISVVSTDAAYFSDRIAFNYLEVNDATSSADAPREYKDSGSVVISNTGEGDLDVASITVSGPFMLADPDALDDLTLAPGESTEVEVLFDREAYTPPAANADSGVFTGTLTIVSDDADQPVSEIQLAGFWQARDEGGWEPNLNELWQVYGFGNTIEGLSTLDGGGESALSDSGIYQAANDEEVMSRYWQIADGVETATITQLAALHGYGGSLMAIHAPGDKATRSVLLNHASDNSQTLLPLTSSGAYATTTLTRDQIPDSWLGDDVFGLSSANFSSDPSLNGAGIGTPDAEDEGLQRGYMVRMIQALDTDGNAIANTYFMVVDFNGINYDYNDNVYLIQGIEPAARTPFNDTATPWAVAEDSGLTLDAALFDEGAPYVAYHDSSETQLGSDFRDTGVDIVGEGDAIGNIQNGEWVEYTINVEAAGAYNLSFLTALGASGGNARSITASFTSDAGNYETTTVGVDYSGSWSNYESTDTGNVVLEAGEQTMRLTFNGGSMNVASFSFVEATQSAFTDDGTPWEIGEGLTIDAADYDVGGPEIAYQDSSEEQLGVDSRGEGVDLRDDGQSIGWIADGEWVEYTLDVAEAGVYQLSFAAATTSAGRTVTASVEQDGVFYTSAAPQAVANTDGWDNYQANSGIELDLAAGEQTLRLTFNGGAMNLQSFTLTPESNASSAANSPSSLVTSMEGQTDALLQAVDEMIVPSDDVVIAGVDEHPDIATVA